MRADSVATAERIRTLFADWLAPDVRDENGEAIESAFSVRLESDRPGRGPKAVPQLRYGGTLLARSRNADDVVNAFDRVLGGVLARQDEERLWYGFRTFVVGDRAVLVEASPPALIADAGLRRAGVVELPVWSVSVDGETVHVPPPLTATGTSEEPASDGTASDGWTSYRLTGLVALDACHHVADADGDIGSDPAQEHDAVYHPTTPGAVLARFASRQPSASWFQTVEGLVAGGRVHVGTDRAGAAAQLRALLADDRAG